MWKIVTVSETIYLIFSNVLLYKLMLIVTPVVWTDGRLESQPFGHCDINLDISTTQCDAGNGVTATWRPIMECLVYGSNNYCGGFGA